MGREFRVNFRRSDREGGSSLGDGSRIVPWRKSMGEFHAAPPRHPAPARRAKSVQNSSVRRRAVRSRNCPPMLATAPVRSHVADQLRRVRPVPASSSRSEDTTSTAEPGAWPTSAHLEMLTVHDVEQFELEREPQLDHPDTQARDDLETGCVDPLD